MAVTVGSLFSGIGGLDLGFERAGFEVRWQVEIDPWCRRVLAKHWPNVPKYEDVRDVGANELEWVDVVVGGFPCQDISAAGKRAGLGGTRSGLWAEYARLISVLRPRYAIVENVANILSLGLGQLLSDLSAIGYDAEWEVISACAFGAPHSRPRLFLVAYPASTGCQTRSAYSMGAAAPGAAAFTHDCWRQGASGTRRVAHGVPRRVDRLRGLGNAVVPQVAQYVAECVMQHYLATEGGD